MRKINTVMAALAATLAIGAAFAPASAQEWGEEPPAISKDEIKTCIKANLAHFLVAQSNVSSEDQRYSEAMQFWISFSGSMSDWSQSDNDQISTETEALMTQFFVEVESLPYQSRSYAANEFLAPYSAAIAPCAAKRQVLSN